MLEVVGRIERDGSGLYRLNYPGANRGLMDAEGTAPGCYRVTFTLEEGGWARLVSADPVPGSTPMEDPEGNVYDLSCDGLTDATGNPVPYDPNQPPPSTGGPGGGGNGGGFAGVDPMVLAAAAVALLVLLKR